MFNKRNAAMAFIFVTVALDMLALGIIIPIWPTPIKHFTAFWGIAGSAEQVYMTKRVRDDEQGELQGALGAMRSIAMIGAPMAFAALFAFFIKGGASGIEFPAAPWDLAALLLLISIPDPANVAAAFEAQFPAETPLAK